MSKKHHHTEEEIKQEEVKANTGETDLPENYEPEIEVKPEDELKAQKAAVSDYYEHFVRLSADFDNYRKRTEREKVSFLAYGKKQFAQQLLPAYEVLLRQQEKMNAQKAPEECSAEVKSLEAGMKMIVAQLDKIFQAEGIVRMDVLDKPYDPATQEVVAMLPSSEAQDGLVLQEVQMGFMMDGQVLRPARVIVGQQSEG